MWTRIYLIALAVFLLPMAFLTYYSWDWLRSIGSPQAAIEGYSYYSNLSWILLWFSSVVLLILANVVLAKYRRSWAMWTTFLYFTFFILMSYFWLGRSAIHFQNENGFQAAGISWGPVLGVMLCAAAAAFVFFNQFTVLRMSESMHPTVVEPDLEEADGLAIQANDE
ncbi:MAG: hypothetical protein M3449_05465 [Acidobacteriota bacterium]|nr:hypothetical protein [Acidobacteriota bacterium]MDQ3490494.1 hypothetical protein [Acidobacteriota bacterium]